MRILVITDISGYMRGGVPTETRRLINGLVDRGHVVGLIADVPLSDIQPITHYPLKLPIDESLGAAVSAALDNFRPDFVHVMCMSSKGVLALAPVLSKAFWALTVHSVPPYERKLNRWHGHEGVHYAARAVRFLLNTLAWRWIFIQGLAPVIIVHSEFVKDVVVNYGAKLERVCLIPLPFEGTTSNSREAQTAFHGADPLLVTVAGFAHTKGQHDVVKALPSVMRRFPRVRYQMIGEMRDATYLAYVHNLAEQRGITDNLIVSPDLDEAQKLLALQAADVYIQPSHEEGFCLAYAEAAAIVPRLLGTNAGAIPAISRDDAGARVVSSKNPSAIGDALIELLTTSFPKTLMKSRVERLEREFALKDYLSAHEHVYATKMRHP